MILNGAWSGWRLVLIVVPLLAVTLWGLHACRLTLDDGPEVPIVGYAKAFPKLKFTRPLYLGVAPGSTDLFVLEQNGIISRFANDPAVETKTTFLDLTDRVGRRFSEEGLLGLAFHPEFAENGHFFVRYSSGIDDRHEYLSRFARGSDGLGDPASELVILKQAQPWRNHNGGGVEFGPDGYLYVSFGDGGKAGDPKKSGQDLATWLGTILRIDVDASSAAAPYVVPADNPFVGRDGALPEIWAYGLRNPWRFSFDRATGRLWCGDVGQNAWEEISIIERGGNYGWNTFEAKEKFRGGVALNGDTHVAPVFAYKPEGRGWGRRASVTGGYVYRGSKYPEFRGSYFFGDYEKRRMWLLRPSASAEAGYESVVLPKGPKALASFGEDHRGELYLVSLDGAIYQLTRQVTEEKLPFPKRLSDAGIFASIAELAPAEGVVGYDVNSPLWSDGAEKSRFVRLPAGKKAKFDRDKDWEYPVGTLFVKHFALPAKGSSWRQLETRVIQRESDGWAAASYVWNEEQTDATLRPEGTTIQFEGATGPRRWTVPSRDDCAVCHTTVTHFLLGVDRTEQMNVGTQLRSLAQPDGILGNDPGDIAKLPQLADPYDEQASLDDRARSYLDSNCAGCHQPDGPGNAALDLRFDRSLADSGLLGEPQQGDLGITDAKIVAPAHPDRSVLLHRVQVRDEGAMPTLGSDIPDPVAVEFLRKWIEELSVSKSF